MTFPILSVILLTPLVAALILALLPGRLHDTIRQLSALAMIIVTLLTLFVYADYDMALGGMQYTEYMPWITDLGVAYSLGVDGISLPMLLLSSVVGLAAVYSSWHVEKRVKEYFVLLLIVIAGVSGAFLVRDLFFFLVLCEMVVIPAYLMVMIWGSSERVTKEHAAMKMTIPIAIYCALAFTPRYCSAVFKSSSTATPMKALETLPRPPVTDTPPSAHAAMASIS